MSSDGNIGPRRIRRHLWIGGPLLIAGSVASFLDRSYLGQVVAFFGFLSVFQALDRTSVSLAARGARDLGEGVEGLGSAEEMAEFRARARKIYLRTFVATLGLLLAGRAWLAWRP